MTEGDPETPEKYKGTEDDASTCMISRSKERIYDKRMNGASLNTSVAGGSGVGGLEEVVLVFAGELLERLALRLRSRPDRDDEAEEHEQGEDLDDVRDPVVRAAAVLPVGGGFGGNGRSWRVGAGGCSDSNDDVDRARKRMVGVDEEARSAGHLEGGKEESTRSLNAMIWAIIAPSLPEPAEMPWAVER